MGFFDSITELFEAAAPWTSVEAEAVVRAGGTSTETTPAQKDEDQGDSGEAKDESGPTPEKRMAAQDDQEDQVSGDEASGVDEDADEDEEIEDPKVKFEEECKESKQCAPAKHHFDECVERVTAAADKEHKGPHEDCVEEFFHLAHCANQCAAPKLWSVLK